MDPFTWNSRCRGFCKQYYAILYHFMGTKIHKETTDNITKLWVKLILDSMDAGILTIYPREVIDRECFAEYDEVGLGTMILKCPVGLDEEIYGILQEYGDEIR